MGRRRRRNKKRGQRRGERCDGVNKKREEELTAEKQETRERIGEAKVATEKKNLERLGFGGVSKKGVAED